MQCTSVRFELQPRRECQAVAVFVDLPPPLVEPVLLPGDVDVEPEVEPVDVVGQVLVESITVPSGQVMVLVVGPVVGVGSLTAVVVLMPRNCWTACILGEAESGCPA